MIDFFSFSAGKVISYLNGIGGQGWCDGKRWYIGAMHNTEKKMLLDNVEISSIAKYTGLSVEEIEKLRESGLNS